MRTAIVGCGAIAKIHVDALGAVPGAEIVAMVDQRESAARAMAEPLGARAYTRMADMLASERPDIVHVLTPPHTHAPLGLEALEAGAHVLVEKPMATSLADAKSLVAAGERTGLVVTTSHNYLFKPSVARARDLLDRGVIGDVIDVESFYGVSADESTMATAAGAHWSWRLPGGVFTNFLPHAVYLASAFQGPIEDVAAVDVGYPPHDPERTTELVVSTRSATATGRLVLSGRISPYMKYVDVRGTRGTLRADLVRETCTVHRDNEGPGAVTKVAYNAEAIGQLAAGTLISTAKVLGGAWKSYMGLRILIRETHEAIAAGRPVPVSSDDGLRMVETMERIWEQAPQLTRPPSTQRRGAEEPQTRAEQRARTTIPERVLVTGATGFLGSRVVAALHRSGAHVRALVRDPRGVPFDVERRADLVVGDLSQPEVLAAAVEGVDAVVHCAAVTTNQASWDVHDRVNIHGTRALAAAAARAGVRRFVHVSSVIVYGLDPDGHGPVSEATPLAVTTDPWAFYERSKVGAEKALAEVADRTGLETVIARPGILYGQGRPSRRGFLRFGDTSVTIGTGDNHLPLTHVDTVVDAVTTMVAADGLGGRAFNIVDEPQRRLREIIDERGRRLPLPASVLRGVAAILEGRARRAGATTPPRLSRFVVGTATRDVVYDTTRAREVLGVGM